MGLVPDGKMYAYDMDQHNVFLQTSFARGISNFSNFRLGLGDGRPAETLGLDNHRIAKFRYVEDSLEDLWVHFFDLRYYYPRDYAWDFGDGNSSVDMEPIHEYAEKGVYEVCLTVSNIYDTNIGCMTVWLGTTPTYDQEIQ